MQHAGTCVHQSVVCLAHLVRVNLLDTGGVACQHFNPEPRHRVQVAAGVALCAKLSQPGQLLEGLQVIQSCKPASQIYKFF